MPNFSTRLSKHRKDLGLSQQALAERCGVTWQVQQAYEAGQLKLNAAYLQALADSGLEVAYLTTGEYPPLLPEGMSREHFALLENFLHCDAEAQAEVMRMLEESAARNPGPHPRAPVQECPGEIIDLTAARLKRGDKKPFRN